MHSYEMLLMLLCRTIQTNANPLHLSLVNYTVTGSNAVGTEKLKVTIHNPPKEIHDTLPPPEVSKNCRKSSSQALEYKIYIQVVNYSSWRNTTHG